MGSRAEFICPEYDSLSLRVFSSSRNFFQFFFKFQLCAAFDALKQENLEISEVAAQAEYLAKVLEEVG
jgi:hypothetical protein